MGIVGNSQAHQAGCLQQEQESETHFCPVILSAEIVETL